MLWSVKFNFIFFWLFTFFFISNEAMSSPDINKEKVLEEFRNAWKQEVQNKAPKNNFQKPSSSSEEKEDITIENGIAEMVERTESLTTKESGAQITAMDHYVIAVDHERQGKLGKGKYFLGLYIEKSIYLSIVSPQHWTAIVALLN
jgi:hypothetical protein